jgi:hypothetical protein
MVIINYEFKFITNFKFIINIKKKTPVHSFPSSLMFLNIDFKFDNKKSLLLLSFFISSLLRASTTLCEIMFLILAGSLELNFYSMTIKSSNI